MINPMCLCRLSIYETWGIPIKGLFSYMSSVTGATIPGGLEFGPTPVNQRMYHSLYRHRGHGSPLHKTVWATSITPPMEYAIFCESDTNDWRTVDGDYWSLYDGGNTEIGADGERLCRFQKTTNPSDPWHGFPVSPQKKESDLPPVTLLDMWLATGVIEPAFRKRVLLRQI